MANVGEQINQVLDNIGKQMGVAADRVIPAITEFANKVFTDYQCRHFAYAGIGLCFIILGLHKQETAQVCERIQNTW